jgi:hypothetical protein
MAIATVAQHADMQDHRQKKAHACRVEVANAVPGKFASRDQSKHQARQFRPTVHKCIF